MSRSGTYNFQEVAFKGGRCVLLFLLSVGSNVDEKAEAPVVIIDHSATLEKNEVHAQWSNNMTP